jgi:hypothetical protein
MEVLMLIGCIVATTLLILFLRDLNLTRKRIKSAEEKSYEDNQTKTSQE